MREGYLVFYLTSYVFAGSKFAGIELYRDTVSREAVKIIFIIYRLVAKV